MQVGPAIASQPRRQRCFKARSLQPPAPPRNDADLLAVARVRLRSPMRHHSGLATATRDPLPEREHERSGWRRRRKTGGTAAAKRCVLPETTRRSRTHASATVLVLTCAASAGAHAGAVPAHLKGEPRLGAAFLIAAVLLIAAAIAVAAHPEDRRITGAAGLLLAGLMLAYLATRTTGIPVLDPEPEALDAVGIATNVVETLGVLAALRPIQPVGRHIRPAHLQEVSR